MRPSFYALAALVPLLITVISLAMASISAAGPCPPEPTGC